jgi:hypothetical protein
MERNIGSGDEHHCGWFQSPSTTAKHQQPVNAVQFENVESFYGNVTFVAASKMFHESSDSDVDDREVKA